MKLLITLFVLLLLQSCTTQDSRQQLVVKPGNIPTVWQAKGRLGVVHDNKMQNLGFVANFKDQNFNLTLTSALGMGEVNIVSSIQGLQINGNTLKLNLHQWMKRTLGWHFPLDKLPAIVFKHQLDVGSDWQIEITKFKSFKEMSVAKIIKLNHKSKPIRIKFLLQEITATQVKLAS